MIILGIDPGLTGALAFYDTATKTVDVHDMPVVSVVRNGKNKNEVSAALTSDIIAEHLKGMPSVAFLERVNAMPGQGVTSVFSFGRSSGIIEGILAAYDIQTHIVIPQRWQKAMDVRGGKDGSRERAMQLLPASAGKFNLKKHDGRADAALIALYGSAMVQK
jgi:crossover junction endodeoxyribonuclease RuvC